MLSLQSCPWGFERSQKRAWGGEHRVVFALWSSNMLSPDLSEFELFPLLLRGKRGSEVRVHYYYI